eukprot:scaffold150350_cov22-Tisochrysis_lutea.AAC.1
MVNGTEQSALDIGNNKNETKIKITEAFAATRHINALSAAGVNRNTQSNAIPCSHSFWKAAGPWCQKSKAAGKEQIHVLTYTHTHTFKTEYHPLHTPGRTRCAPLLGATFDLQRALA